MISIILQDACEGDQKRIRRDPLINGFLLSNLTSMSINGCNKISILLSPSSLRSLERLQELEVLNCENIEEMVSQEERETSANKIILHGLQHLLFQGLPKLKAFCQGSYNFDFPSLREVRIEDCPSMEVFSGGSSHTPKLEDVNIEIEPHSSNYIHKRDLNATIQGFKAFVTLQKSEMLSWSELHNEYFIKNPKMEIMVFHKLSVLVPFNKIHVFQHLQQLSIGDCDSLLEVFESKEGVDTNNGDTTMHMTHYKLQKMRLYNLPNLRQIWKHNITRLVSFQKLTSIEINLCNNLKSLLTHSIARSLVQLQELIVQNCDIMEEIVTKEEESTRGGNKVRILFPTLNRLALKDLPKLKGFCSGDYDYDLLLCDEEDMKVNNKKMDITRCRNLLSLVSLNEMQMLQHVMELTIKECDSLVKVFESEGGVDAKKGDATTHYELQRMNLENLPELRHIWGPTIMGHESFQKLTSIEINLCKNLKSLLTHSMARSLVQLQKLFVENCNMMEEIVTKEDENIKGGSKVKILFPKLKNLKLVDLPMLECFCSRDYDYDLPLCDVGENKEMNNKQVEISFPELEYLSLWSVPKLKCFCSGAYDYDLMLSSSCNDEITEECPQIATFPNATVTVTTPKLRYVATEPFRIKSFVFFRLEEHHLRTLEDLNLTIYYIQNSEKYKVELQKLETFRCIEQDQYQHLLGYISRQTHLVLDNCNKLLNCIPSNMMHIFRHFDVLKVRQCGSLEEIFESEGVGANGYEGDSMLFQMELDSLPKLKHIWKNHGRVLGFQKLRYLTIRGCHDLKYVFPDVSMARNLLRLEVYECNKMEEIIQNNSVQQQQPKEAKFKFPILSRLTLKKLPSLKFFCSSPCYFELPWCRRITIEECPKMENFSYRTLYTPRLISLSVDEKQLDIDEDINEIIRKQHDK